MASKRQENLAKMSKVELENMILHEPGLGRGWMKKYSFENAVKYMGFSNEEKAVFLTFPEDFRDFYLANIVQTMTPRQYDVFLKKQADKVVAEEVKAGRPPRGLRFSDLLITSALNLIKQEDERGLIHAYERLGESALAKALEVQRSGNSKPKKCRKCGGFKI